MPLPNATDTELIILLHCRLNTIEAALSSIIPGFNTDLELCTHEEIDDINILSAAQKTKLKAIATAIKNRHKVKV